MESWHCLNSSARKHLKNQVKEPNKDQAQVTAKGTQAKDKLEPQSNAGERDFQYDIRQENPGSSKMTPGCQFTFPRSLVSSQYQGSQGLAATVTSNDTPQTIHVYMEQLPKLYTYIGVLNGVNVSNYSIHGWSGPGQFTNGSTMNGSRGSKGGGTHENQ